VKLKLFFKIFFLAICLRSDIPYNQPKYKPLIKSNLSSILKVRKVIEEGQKPVFGICLGHQLLAMLNFYFFSFFINCFDNCLIK